MLTVLQKVVFRIPKGGLSHGERPPFGMRKAAFWKTVCRLLMQPFARLILFFFVKFRTKHDNWAYFCIRKT